MKIPTFFLIIMLLIIVHGCTEPIYRNSTVFDGSAYWALQKAQPEITNFAADAEIYNILGTMIWKDGRLPSNTGEWSFVSWSQTRKQTCQVTVNYQGTTSKSIQNQSSPPNTGSGFPIPVGWKNSIEIFSIITSKEIINDNYANLVVFNLANYTQSPNNAVWAVNFSQGINPLVTWNGTFIGNQ